MEISKHLHYGVLLESAVYIAIGLVVFGLTLWIMDKIAPFSVVKEIVEDQNTALGIVMGSVIIGVAMILSAILR